LDGSPNGLVVIDNENRRHIISHDARTPSLTEDKYDAQE